VTQYLLLLYHLPSPDSRGKPQNRGGCGNILIRSLLVVIYFLKTSNHILKPSIGGGGARTASALEARTPIFFARTRRSPSGAQFFVSNIYPDMCTSGLKEFQGRGSSGATDHDIWAG